MRNWKAMKIHELFTDESKWTQGENAIDALGFCVPVVSTDAVCWCLFGALTCCYWEENDFAWALGKLRAELKKESITDWNDASERTFQEVRDLVVRLGI